MKLLGLFLIRCVFTKKILGGQKFVKTGTGKNRGFPEHCAMGDDIGLGLLFMAICFDFRSTNVVQLGNWNLYFYWFQHHLPLINQLIVQPIVIRFYAGIDLK